MRASAWRAGLGHLWQTRRRAERWLLLSAGAALALTALLLLGLRPAWRTLQAAPAEQARLDAQWLRMQALQAQLQPLSQAPQRRFDEVALRASLAPLGAAAQLSIEGEQAQVRLVQAQPEAVAAWLLQSRVRSGAVVRQAQLTHSPPGQPPAWSGQLVLALAPR